MSGVMERANELWNLGLSGAPDKYLCVDHIEDVAVRRFIRRNGQSDFCDYCGKKKKVVLLEDVMVFLMETVMYFYTDPVEFARYESAEGGYLIEHYDAWELLTEEFGLEINDSDLYNDVQDSIDYSRTWADEQGYYGTGPDRRLLSWKYFSLLVKHQVRYLFPEYKGDDSGHENGDIIPSKMLREIGKLVSRNNLIKTLEPGRIIFRCRQHRKAEIIKTVEQMCTPKVEYCVNPNRMSPAGIPMFYGAFEEETTLMETLDTDDTDSNFTTVQFQVQNSINIIDLSDLPRLPSPFDQEARKKYFELTFLRNFVADLTKSIERDQKTHIEYVPTQIVTEYFRYAFNKKIHGIIYPSSRVRGKNAIVLFYDHFESMKRLTFLNSTITTKDISSYDPFLGL